MPRSGTNCMVELVHNLDSATAYCRNFAASAAPLGSFLPVWGYKYLPSFSFLLRSTPQCITIDRTFPHQAIIVQGPRTTVACLQSTRPKNPSHSIAFLHRLRSNWITTNIVNGVQMTGQSQTSAPAAGLSHGRATCLASPPPLDSL
jgi:hypothetical protein